MASEVDEIVFGSNMDGSAKRNLRNSALFEGAQGMTSRDISYKVHGAYRYEGPPVTNDAIKQH